MDAHLFFQAQAVHRIAHARIAVGVGDELGDDEQADAARALRRPFDARQHQMDDVLGQILLTAGDPDLLAGDLVGPIALRDRLGAQQAEVRAAVGLGQVHGAGPLERGQLGKVELFLLGGAGLLDRRIAAVGQARVHRKGHVRRRGHLGERHVHNVRQSLAAVGWVRAQGGPAGLDQFGIGVLEAGRRGHCEIGTPDAALFVAGAVQRGQHLGGELARLLQDRLDGVHRRVGEGREARVAFQLQHVAQQENIVPDGGLVSHGGLRERRAGTETIRCCAGGGRQAADASGAGDIQLPRR